MNTATSAPKYGQNAANTTTSVVKGRILHPGSREAMQGQLPGMTELVKYHMKGMPGCDGNCRMFLSQTQEWDDTTLVSWEMNPREWMQLVKWWHDVNSQGTFHVMYGFFSEWSLSLRHCICRAYISSSCLFISQN